MAKKQLPGNVVKIKKAPKKSYNPNRKISSNTLLMDQLRNLHRLELELPPDQRTGLDFSAIDTEGEASEYIRRMTAILHPQVQKGAGR